MHIDDETGQSIPPRVKCYVTIALMLSVVSVIAEAVVEQTSHMYCGEYVYRSADLHGFLHSHHFILQRLLMCITSLENVSDCKAVQPIAAHISEGLLIIAHRFEAMSGCTSRRSVKHRTNRCPHIIRVGSNHD